MIVTAAWLKSVTTQSHSHLNRKQARLLGLTFPLGAGWKDRLIGMGICEETQKAIERAAGPGRNERKRQNFHNGHYHDESKFGKTFATIYTRPHGNSWVWSYEPPTKWPKEFLTTSKGEVKL